MKLVKKQRMIPWTKLEFIEQKLFDDFQQFSSSLFKKYFFFPTSFPSVVILLIHDGWWWWGWTIQSYCCYCCYAQRSMYIVRYSIWCMGKTWIEKICCRWILDTRYMYANVIVLFANQILHILTFCCCIR